MTWQVGDTDEFEEWWSRLDDNEQASIAASVGRPWRTLYAFDPRHAAILLIGGYQTGDGRWYETHVSIADQFYDVHLEELKTE